MNGLRSLGWTQPTPDQTIRALYKASPLSSVKLPGAAPTSDNSHLCCNLDQLSLGSCTQQGASQIMFMEMVRRGLVQFIPSRLAGYYWNRNRDGNATEDTGATVGGSFEVMADMGVPEEAVWPYEIERFAVRPPPEVVQNAFDRKGSVGVNYIPIRESGDSLIDTIERVLTSGRGVAFGVSVTESFCATYPTGIVQAPKFGERIAGGHCLSIVGHNHAERWMRIKNSWGADWCEPGQPAGCCRFSYDYITDGSDFWFVQLSTGGL